MAERKAARVRPPHLVAAVAAIALVLALGVIVTTLTGPTGTGSGSIPLSEIPDGVSAARVLSTSMFLVRDGDDVRALSVDARHLSGEVVWWCEQAGVFVEDAHGSVFDQQGHKIGGPARGALNEFEAVVTDGQLIVDVSTVTVGQLSPRGVIPSGTELNGAPLTFCPDKLVPLAGR